nr:MAG TPA: hypothetical protein [Bacteriophage sp.]
MPTVLLQKSLIHEQGLQTYMCYRSLRSAGII